MEKKMLLSVYLIGIMMTYASGAIGFIPQGKKMSNGQMDPKSIINISRTDIIALLDSGRVPIGIRSENIYYQPWLDGQVRKKFADILRTKLEEKTNLKWTTLRQMMSDSLQTPIHSLTSRDTVYSNGLSSLNGKSVVQAPVRLARMTRDGTMEQYMQLPNGVILYLTCLNIDIRNETISQSQDEEGLPNLPSVSKTEVKTNYRVEKVIIYDTIHKIVEKYNTVITDEYQYNQYVYNQQSKELPNKNDQVLIFSECSPSTQTVSIIDPCISGYSGNEVMYNYTQPQVQHYAREAILYVNGKRIY